MKKGKKVLAVSLFSFLLTGCDLPFLSKPSKENEEKYTVTFMYNAPSNDSVYLTYELGYNDVLNVPETPETKDYVFSTWTTDPEGTKSYPRWGLAINQDLTFYAQWKKYSDLTIKKQVDYFEEKLAKVSKDAVKVTKDTFAELGYPGTGFGDKAIFYVADYYEYNRYKDIVTKDYYGYEEDGSKTKYGEEQIYVDENFVYDAYKALDEDTEDSFVKNAREDEGNDDKYLSIDFQSLYKSVNETLVSLTKNPNIEPGNLIYEFTGDPTQINKDTTNYSYESKFAYTTYVSTYDTWQITSYSYSFGLVFTAGFITSAIVQKEYYILLGEDVQAYQIEESQYDFYYNGGEFQDFTGTRLTF